MADERAYDPEKRLRQLRRRMLVLAKLQGPGYGDRWVPAANFLAVRDDQGVEVADELEAESLLAQLLELKLLEEWQPMGLGGRSKKFAQRRLRLSDRGYALWSQELDPIPMVADERLGD